LSKEKFDPKWFRFTEPSQIMMFFAASKREIRAFQFFLSARSLCGFDGACYVSGNHPAIPVMGTAMDKSAMMKS